ncbi:MAG TPA: hypothetical protein VFA20_27800 [Myxococcaceae bacterium]|nr:hypothetical protein [Myxococcaceae bacterium]
MRCFRWIPLVAGLACSDALPPELRAFQRVAPLEVGPPLPLGALDFGPAGFNTGSIAAAGSPSTALVVMQNWRSGSYDVFGARVSATMQLLDPGGIKIAGDRLNDATRPQVAFDGTNWLVVWEDSYSELAVHGARVSLAGQVLDPDGFAISPPGAQATTPAVAGGNGMFLVAWEDVRAGSLGYDIRGARVSSSGQVLDPQSLPIAVAAGDQGFPGAGWNGAEFLAVWDDSRSGDFELYGARISVDGGLADPAGQLLYGAPGIQQEARLAFDGSEYLMVWEDYGTAPVSAWAMRLTDAGVPLDPAGLRLGSGPQNQYGVQVVAVAGSFLTTWFDYQATPDTRQVLATRVSPSGVVDAVPAVAAAAGTNVSGQPVLAVASGAPLLAMLQTGADWGVGARRLAPTGTGLDPTVPLMIAAAAQQLPSLTFDGQRLWAAWSRFGATTSDIRLGEVLLDGGAAAPVERVISDAGYASRPMIAFDGQGLVVVWAETAGPAGARVALDGAVQPFALPPMGFYPPVLVRDGDGVVMLWVAGSSPAVYGSRLPGDGGPPGPAFLISAPDAGATSVSAAPAGNDAGAWVAWDQLEASGASIQLARIQGGGVAGAPVPVAPPLPQQQGPAVATAPSGEVLVAWVAPDGGDWAIRAARAASDGSLVDPAGFVVASGTGRAGGALAAFDGVDFVVAWNVGVAPFSEERRGARVGLDGSVRDPGGWSLGTSPTDFLSSGLASDGRGRTALAFSRYEDPPLGNDRAYVQVIENLVVGEACASPAQCSSGLCERGACCPPEGCPPPEALAVGCDCGAASGPAVASLALALLAAAARRPRR